MNCVSKQVLSCSCYHNPFKKTLWRFRVSSTQLHPTSSSAPIFSSVSTTQVGYYKVISGITLHLWLKRSLKTIGMVTLSIVLLEAPNTTYTMNSQDYLRS